VSRNTKGSTLGEHGRGATAFWRKVRPVRVRVRSLLLMQWHLPSHPQAWCWPANYWHVPQGYVPYCRAGWPVCIQSLRRGMRSYLG